MRLKICRFSLLLSSMIGYAQDGSFLDALRHVAETTSENEWTTWLKASQIDPCDNHILERLILSLPMQRDIRLPALLSICEEIAAHVPPTDPNFTKDCIREIGEQLVEPGKADSIYNWIWDAYAANGISPQENTLFADVDASTILASSESVGPVEELFIEKIARSNGSFNGSVSSCLNVCNIPYMDLAYYLSRPSLFTSPGFFSMSGQETPRKNAFLIMPHYTYADITLFNTDSRMDAPGISVVASSMLANHWVLSGMIDGARTFNHWSPENQTTHDHTNRFSLATSLACLGHKAYGQVMVLGTYNGSTVTSPSTSSYHINHWDLGIRLDGALYFDLFSERFHYTLQPYLALDYFSVFQQSVNNANIAYLKDARFFQSKALLKCFTEIFDTSCFSLIPQVSVGLSYATLLSKTTSATLCSHLPNYPSWCAVVVDGAISMCWHHFVMKALLDINYAPSAFICSGNVTLGWNW